MPPAAGREGPVSPGQSQPRGREQPLPPVKCPLCAQRQDSHPSPSKSSVADRPSAHRGRGWLGWSRGTPRT